MITFYGVSDDYVNIHKDGEFWSEVYCPPTQNVEIVVGTWRAGVRLWFKWGRGWSVKVENISDKPLPWPVVVHTGQERSGQPGKTLAVSIDCPPGTKVEHTDLKWNSLKVAREVARAYMEKTR